jgi:hypothetical protein
LIHAAGLMGTMPRQHVAAERIRAPSPERSKPC